MNIHKQLKDENICRCEMVFNDNSNYYMLLELCDAGSLSQMAKKKKLTDEEIQQILLQLIKALEYLHSNQIIHRDLKPQNVFLKRENRKLVCKLGDFGLSIKLQNPNEHRFTLCGTPNFLSPETIISHIQRRRALNK